MDRLLNGAKLPKMDTLKADFQKLAAEKKSLYTRYRAAQKDMREIVAVKGNVDRLLGLTGGAKNKETCQEKSSLKRGKIMDKPLVRISYKLANGSQICVEVSTSVQELLEQSDRQIRSQRRQDRRHLDFKVSTDGNSDSPLLPTYQPDPFYERFVPAALRKE